MLNTLQIECQNEATVCHLHWLKHTFCHALIKIKNTLIQRGWSFLTAIVNCHSFVGFPNNSITFHLAI